MKCSKDLAASYCHSVGGRDDFIYKRELVALEEDKAIVDVGGVATDFYVRTGDGTASAGWE